MDNKNTVSLNKLNPFKLLSEEGLTNIVKNSEKIVFNIGQPLSKKEIVQNSILFILEGQARLIGQENNEEYTIGKVSSGAFIGLASLLRVNGCEEVSAITKITALSIPDHIIISLYKNETAFRNWCKSKLFPSEIHALIKNIVKDVALQKK